MLSRENESALHGGRKSDELLILHRPCRWNRSERDPASDRGAVHKIIPRSPVEVFCQRMSVCPSPLKSPVPAICQAVGTPGSETQPVIVCRSSDRFRAHRVDVFCQRMSVWPPPLKSPVPRSAKRSVGPGATHPTVTVVPFIR